MACLSAADLTKATALLGAQQLREAILRACLVDELDIKRGATTQALRNLSEIMAGPGLTEDYQKMVDPTRSQPGSAEREGGS